MARILELTVERVGPFRSSALGPFDLLTTSVLFLLPGLAQADPFLAPRELTRFAYAFCLVLGPLENAGGFVLSALFL